MSDARRTPAVLLKAAAVLACVVSTMTASAATMEPAQNIDNRINLVGKLINDSSASREVDASGNPTAIRLRAEAQNHYESAIEARAAGDSQHAARSLDKAIRSMYAAIEATRDAEKDGIDHGDKYDRRIATIDALMSAHERIAAEKGLSKNHETLQKAISKDMAAAEAFLRDGNIKQANDHAETAYEIVRHAVEDLRQGETLVRELKFANNEEEYLYELDRNDTHRMLISLLVEKQTIRPDSKQQVEERIAAALELRRKADEYAFDSKYDEAITLLEQSTGELVKAIRSAGIYIPG